MEQIPVQAIVHCGPGGELCPLRFQYEDEKHSLHTVHICQVLDSRKVDFVGLEELLYLCKEQGADGEHLYELKYTIKSHKWVLFRKVF